eukprot:1159060-Pelagomonas_calceolata.AAC.4
MCTALNGDNIDTLLMLRADLKGTILNCEEHASTGHCLTKSIVSMEYENQFQWSGSTREHCFKILTTYGDGPPPLRGSAGRAGARIPGNVLSPAKRERRSPECAAPVARTAEAPPACRRLSLRP